MRKSFFSRGFTLIELLVVVAIIGVLSATVLASLNTARGKSNDARRVADLRQIQRSLELYASSNNGAYPSTASHWQSACTTLDRSPSSPGILDLSPTYIPSFPTDPQMNAAAGKCCYLYKSDGVDYKVLVGYDCASTVPPANYNNQSLRSLIDPQRPTLSWAVYSGPIQTCPSAGNGCW